MLQFSQCPDGKGEKDSPFFPGFEGNPKLQRATPLLSEDTILFEDRNVRRHLAGGSLHHLFYTNKSLCFVCFYNLILFESTLLVLVKKKK